MPYIDPEVILEAKRMDLLTYLQNYEPHELVHFSGSTYCTRSHDSLKISNGKWFWWSRGIGGKSALDYLIKVRELSFTDAVEQIMGRAAKTPPVFVSQKEQKPKTLLLPEPYPYTDEVEQYLVRRGIDRGLIHACIADGRIYESRNESEPGGKIYINAVFVGFDAQGQRKYAALRGINGYFKGEATGSDKHYSFAIPALEPSASVHLFESAVDLLSYATLKEYNKMLMDKATGANSIVQEKYVTISVCKKNIEEAKNYFARVGADLIAHFMRLGSRCTEMDATEKLRALHDFYRTGEETSFRFELSETMRKGHDFRDFICPDTLEFEADHFRMGSRFGRVLFLREYASYIKDDMVTELTDLDRNLMLSIDVIPVPTDEAVREVENRLLGVETNITNWQRRQNQNNNFSAVIPYDMELQRKESKEFLDDLTTRDQRMMFGVLTLVHTADSLEQLDADTEALLTTARKHLCQFATLKYQQMDGLNTALPITPEKLEKLKSYFDDMNQVAYSTEVQSETHTEVNEEGEEETVTTTTLIIRIRFTSLSYEDAADFYNMSEEQRELLDELMQPEYAALFAAITGVDVWDGVNMTEIVSGLPVGTTGAEVVKAGLTKVGCPYVWGASGPNKFDCSGFAYWCLSQTSSPLGASRTNAAGQAKWCYDNGYMVGRSELQPGDLVFWQNLGCPGCGRWNEIHHVGIYVGNGKVMEASSSKGRVLVRDLWESSNHPIWGFGRPYTK